MQKLLTNLIGKRFSVYVSGEFERTTDFLGFIKLLGSYSDFFQFTKEEQNNYFKQIVESKYGYVDANIYVKIGK